MESLTSSGMAAPEASCFRKTAFWPLKRPASRMTTAPDERLLELGLLVVCAGVGELGLLVLGWVEAWGALSLLLDDGLRGGGDVLAAEPWLPLSSLSGCSARCVLHDCGDSPC